MPLVLAGPHVNAGVVSRPVDLRQVAPTILKALGLRSRDLQAVRYEGTRRLPKFDHHEHDDCNDD